MVANYWRLEWGGLGLGPEGTSVVAKDNGDFTDKEAETEWFCDPGNMSFPMLIHS